MEATLHLHWLLPLVLITARLFGAVGQRCGVPAVVGEILAGVVLGPSVFGVLGAELEAEGDDPIVALAQIGLCALLFRVGLETDLDDAKQTAKPAAVLAIAGMLIPLALGVVVATSFGVSVFASVFVGATLTATSIGVTAAVLKEVGASTGRVANLIFGAAVVDDVVGLVLLAALTASTSATGAIASPVMLAIAQAVAFLGIALLLGRPLTQMTLSLTRWSGSRSTLFVVVFSVLLLTAWASKIAGLEMIIGAYAAGLALARHPERDWIQSELEPVVGLFTPIFFVLVGSAVSLEHLAVGTATGRSTLLLAGILFVVAVAGKMAAPLLVPRLDAPVLVVGSGLVPRGEVGLIFAQVGMSEGVLPPDVFAALALVIAATTFVGPLLLRRVSSTESATASQSPID